MLRHFFLIAVRTFKRQKLFSIINIAGLAVGLTTFILIALYIQYEYSFDTFHKNFDNIYRVEQIAHLADKDDYWTSTVYPLGDAMVRAFPEIDNSAAIRGVWGEYLSSEEDLSFYEENGLYVQNTFFNIFSFNFIDGDPDHALTEPFSMVLTESLAKKYFPGENALGKIITAKNRFPYKITGVVGDIPENSEFNEITYFSSILSIEQVDGWTLDNWGNYSYNTYLLVNPKSNVEQLGTKIKHFLDEKKEDKSTSVTLWLLPLSKVHIDPEPDNNGFLIIIYMYSAIAIFALLIACINFINLTTAYSSARAMEIGIKKAMGSGRKSLVLQFLTESVIFALVATQLAFIIAEFSLPVFNRIVSRNLDIRYFENWQFILFIFSISILSGLLAGTYPALYLSGFKPVKVLKGNTGSSGRNNLVRRILVIFQFVISTMLILSTILLYRQFDYLKNKEMGFNKDNILYLTIDAGKKESSRTFEAIRTELLKNPDIVNATISESIPFFHTSGSNFNWEGNDPDEKINMRRNRVDENYIDTYGMKILDGRNFSIKFSTDSTEACIINETAAEIFGWENPIGKKINDNRFTVVGVVKDFHPNVPFNKIPPFIMLAHNEQVDQLNTYSIRIREGANPVDTRRYIDEVFDSFFPDTLFESRFLSELSGNRTFQIYEAVTSTFGFFSIVTIIISIVGLFGLVAYITRSRRKEIGIRKVHGASLPQIFLILVKDFLMTIGIAILIAWPLGSMIRSIDPAYYKVPVNSCEYFLTALIVVVITLITVSFHTFRAARRNPVEALRYE